MIGRALNIAIISGFLLATAAPAFAADQPKTKADCDKAKGKWNYTRRASAPSRSDASCKTAWLIGTPPE